MGKPDWSFLLAIGTDHTSHAPQIYTIIQPISKYDLWCSNREWSVKRVRNGMIQKGFAKVNNLDWMRRQGEVGWIGSRSDQVFRYAGL